MKNKEINELTGEINGLNEEVKGLKGKITGLKGEINENEKLREEIMVLKKKIIELS